MSDKMKNLITRAITGVFFAAAVVTCFLRPEAMIFLFALVTGLTVWEFTGIVNNIENVSVNRFLSTVAAVYFFPRHGWLLLGHRILGSIHSLSAHRSVYVHLRTLHQGAQFHQ